jgi:hypothetical protein
MRSNFRYFTLNRVCHARSVRSDFSLFSGCFHLNAEQHLLNYFNFVLLYYSYFCVIIAVSFAGRPASGKLVLECGQV